jgi:hypothetical protein
MLDPPYSATDRVNRFCPRVNAFACSYAISLNFFYSFQALLEAACAGVKWPIGSSKAAFFVLFVIDQLERKADLD